MMSFVSNKRAKTTEDKSLDGNDNAVYLLPTPYIDILPNDILGAIFHYIHLDSRTLYERSPGRVCKRWEVIYWDNLKHVHLSTPNSFFHTFQHAVSRHSRLKKLKLVSFHIENEDYGTQMPQIAPTLEELSFLRNVEHLSLPSSMPFASFFVKAAFSNLRHLRIGCADFTTTDSMELPAQVESLILAGQSFGANHSTILVPSKLVHLKALKRLDLLCACWGFTLPDTEALWSVIKRLTSFPINLIPGGDLPGALRLLDSKLDELPHLESLLFRLDDVRGSLMLTCDFYSLSPRLRDLCIRAPFRIDHSPESETLIYVERKHPTLIKLLPYFSVEKLRRYASNSAFSYENLEAIVTHLLARGEPANKVYGGHYISSMLRRLRVDSVREALSRNIDFVHFSHKQQSSLDIVFGVATRGDNELIKLKDELIRLFVGLGVKLNSSTIPLLFNSVHSLDLLQSTGVDLAKRGPDGKLLLFPSTPGELSASVLDWLSKKNLLFVSPSHQTPLKNPFQIIQKVDTAAQLVALGYDATFKDENGNTFLHRIAVGLKSASSFLAKGVVDSRQYGLMLDLENDDGVSLAQVAIRNGYIHVRDLIRNQMKHTKSYNKNAAKIVAEKKGEEAKEDHRGLSPFVMLTPGEIQALVTVIVSSSDKLRNDISIKKLRAIGHALIDAGLLDPSEQIVPGSKQTAKDFLEYQASKRGK